MNMIYLSFYLEMLLSLLMFCSFHHADPVHILLNLYLTILLFGGTILSGTLKFLTIIY